MGWPKSKFSGGFLKQTFQPKWYFFAMAFSDASEYQGSAPADPITGRDHRIHGISWVPTTSTFQIALIQ